MNLSMLDFVHVDDRETFMKQLRINKNQPVEPPQLDNEQASSMPEYAKLRWTPEWFQGKVLLALFNFGRLGAADFFMTKAN